MIASNLNPDKIKILLYLSDIIKEGKYEGSNIDIKNTHPDTKLFHYVSSFIRVDDELFHSVACVKEQKHKGEGGNFNFIFWMLDKADKTNG